MSGFRNRNERNKGLESPIPGCLGRMVNLFDLNASLSGNRMLTEKPHYEGSPVSRSQSDASMSRVVDNRIHDKMMVSELGKSLSNKKSNGTPIKMLIAQEMLKEEVPKQSPPNLVAKLMGLEDLPQQNQLGSVSCRSNLRRSRSRSHSGSFDFMQKEHDEVNKYKDVFEVWQQSCKTYDDSPQKGRKRKESKNEKNMSLVREKFIEAKRLSTDGKLRQSKQFQDALEVLSSNKDLFLQLLQEPNTLLSQHQNLLSVLPPTDSKCITVLKPSKLLDAHEVPKSIKKNGKQINGIVWDNKCNGVPDKPNQPTRIVVLKPSTGKGHEMKTLSSPSSLKTSLEDGFYGDLEDDEPKESTCGIPESPHGHRRDETLLSSVFSNGYVGDESSFSKSEVYYASGNLSDSEVMSPTSRQSWDYVRRIGSPYSSSSFSHASYSPESSVCKEAKKRLSERWAMMSLNGNVQEQRHVRSSSTLGEMLALSDFKKSVESEENCTNTSDLNKSTSRDADIDSSPKILTRSKSLPASSTDFSKDKKDDTKDLTKEKSHKSSLFKGKVSSLFFSKSRKSSKQKSKMSDSDVHQSSRNIANDGSQCISDRVVKGVDAELAGQLAGQHLPEGGFSGNANENQDQPSPISVLELPFEDDDHTAGFSRSSKLNELGHLNKGNLLDKSPLIGSIARTLSWDDSAVGSVSPVLGKTSTKPLSVEEEEEECLLYVQTLLSAAGFINGEVQSDSWHSPESPLDPSLREKYMNRVDQYKQRHQRSFQKLVFDAVNEVLKNGTHKDNVWGQIKEWLSGDGRCVWYGDDEDGGCTTTPLAVEWVVRKEVAGQGWAERLRLQVDDIGKEIEEKLMEHLVEELMLELTGRVILAYTP